MRFPVDPVRDAADHADWRAELAAETRWEESGPAGVVGSWPEGCDWCHSPGCPGNCEPPERAA